MVWIHKAWSISVDTSQVSISGLTPECSTAGHKFRVRRPPAATYALNGGK